MAISLAFIIIPALILCYAHLEEDSDLKEVHVSFVIDRNWYRDLCSLCSEKMTIAEDKKDTLQKEGST